MTPGKHACRGVPHPIGGAASDAREVTLLALLTLLTACLPRAVEEEAPALAGQDVRLTVLHTSDIHSRLIEYEFDPSFTDNGLGLADEAGPYGGIAEIATILKEQRAQAGRVLHVDSGDCFQGAIIFNEFVGEPEVRLLSEVGLDAAVVGNHEFDAGAPAFAAAYANYGSYAALAANYDFEDADAPWATDLEELIWPSMLYEVDGLRIGVIGMANLSSLNSIYDESNSMGITVIEAGDIIPIEAGKLRAQGADIIMVVSHMGYDDDLVMARDIPDIDIIFGGHHHVAIDPPLVQVNEATGKRVYVVHSGAFAKFVGRADVVVRDGEILSLDYSLFPIDNTVTPDAHILDILEEYSDKLDMDYNLDQILGYAEVPLTRYGTTNGDSMLGNFTAEAMRSYPGVETEIAVTNTLGIRSDIGAGNITLDTLYNSMPFDNTITTMFLTGREVQELLDYVTERSTERGCNSQAQVAGLTFDMNCLSEKAENIVINGAPLNEAAMYEMATNDYIANGGSGFEMLERNTTQVDTGISVRDVVMSNFISFGTVPQPGVCEEDGRINAIY